MPDPDTDFLIVGGGSAGCVLAARLSKRASRRVTLIEAGDDLTAGTMRPAMASAYPGRAYFDPALIWPGVSVITGGSRRNDPESRPTMPYTQGRVMGGGSSVNGIGANRGAPADYDEWDGAGATGWTWEACLPFFRRIERDLEIEGALHGRDGPIPIRRVPAADRPGFVRALVTALAARGVPERPDQNGVWEDGAFPLAANCDEDWRRVPTAIGYLTPDVRARPNLRVIPNLVARRILFEGRRAIGVEATGPEGAVTIRARETILSCGALHSPTLLMRSGVGPGAHLRERGLAVVADVPGVGENLMEHPSAGIAAFLPRASRQAGEGRHHIPAIWRFSSGLPGAPAGDMHLALVARGAWHAMGRRMGVVYFWVNKTFGRGRLRLGERINGPPHVDLALLSDARDRARLAMAFRTAAGLMAEVHAAGAAGRPFPARMSERARRFGAPTAKNAFLTGLGGLAVDMAGPFGDGLFRRLASSGDDLAALLADDDALDSFLDEAVTGVWHASGTCRMGAADDPMAVTDAEGRVRGVEGLRVCDASLFPTIPCANINLPTMMVAERIASLIEDGVRRL